MEDVRDAVSDAQERGVDLISGKQLDRNTETSGAGNTSKEAAERAREWGRSPP
jgi:hypothetical protein